MNFTIGSLFDGSGGFPLAATMCGGTPKWASEIEPYPIAVTKSRFPNVKHLGSVTDIKGGEIDPVDVITFGSPCQDLSVAGKRAGLKHEVNGDDETTRSGLFMEAVRIIKEMREATNGVYPRFALWENVPGAFSSNKGEDFRIVLQELIQIVEPSAVMPEVPKAGWPYADSYFGDGWSIAYRVFDAQFWGVPQRRRIIYLVADFRGECAGKVLFEREGLRGYFVESGTPRQGTAPNAEKGVGAAKARSDAYGYEIAPCLSANKHDACVCAATVYNGENITSPLNKTNPQPGDPCHTLSTDSRNYVVFAQNQREEVRDLCVKAVALNAFPGTHQQTFVADVRQPTQYIVRRLTPTECARLQGFPDTWGHPIEKTDFTDEEYRFWLNVRNTNAAINDKSTKDYTKDQMLKWYNSLHTDSSEYKMWGNGIALPCALYVMQGIADVCDTKVSEKRNVGEKMKIMLDKGAKMPTRAHPWDAGLDLYAPADCTVPPTKTVVTFNYHREITKIESVIGSATIDTLVHAQIPEGYVGFIKAKSGLNVKHGLTCTGVIDAH